MDKFWFSILLLPVFVLSMLGADRITGKMFATRSEVIGNHGMVASSQPLATQIGIDILKKGGNAIDAAIAVNAALGLMEPTSCGIGGDLFAIVWDSKTQKLYGINASGTAPLALNLDYFKKQGLQRIPYHGPLPWTVPGCVDGWCELHKKFGKLDMKTILHPAADYAENGFPLSELISYYWQRSVMVFKDYENFQKLYAPGGKAPQKGDIFKNPELAKTLRLIAAKGRDAFYKGEIAKAMVAYSQKVGGFFQMKDFEDFHAEWVEPLSVNYKGFDVWELPPNGQGIAALQMLNMLKTMDLKSLGHNSAEYLHALVEIKKIVYEDRARFYADPRFVKVSLEKLLSDEYAAERLKLFNPNRANFKIPAGDGILQNGDTIYLTVVDKDFNAVSLIQSNYSGFGSGMVPDGLGFCFQDRGQLFSLEEGHPNVIEPGKRPFHTIIPAMLTKNGKPVFTFGVMGGDMQPQGHVQVLLNILEFGMNIQEAGDAARFYHTGSSEPDYGIMADGGELHLESGVAPETVRSLMRKGHRITGEVGGFGGYQGIWIDLERGILIGASESRKDGCAIGY
ncbi:MAG: gamma-glutamyltransferase [Acidobacteria bacterium]|jgi:gamma-glutamyltranspeptidase/glutathione hydrolase|nr:gamma-glutamyltransferase [Acidobacteriota bacterium]